MKCQSLAHLAGGEDPADTRWRPLIESGCRTGLELARAWSILQGEARECCHYFGQELSGQLSRAQEGIGDGAEDGSTRTKVTKEREEMRAAVLNRGLEDYRDPGARPVMSRKQRDKLCSAFLLNVPGAHTSISAPVFKEAVAALICVPSLVCRDRVGKRVGRSRVYLYGDKIVGQNLTGGGWTRRHDSVKSELNSCCVWAGL